jgi:hemerythrin-like domain-containing protein
MKHGCTKPRGCLMIEHRLIERAIALLAAEKERLESGGKLDPVTVDTLVDFIRTYADRCHHGKEEDILFEDLADRPLSAEEKALMDELVEEHKLGRRLTKELVEAKDAVVAGDTGRLSDVISTMGALIGFYPQHIEKEDKRFFPDTERHYSPEELEAMIQSFYTFDMRMIHEKYGDVVGSLENS